MAQENFNSVENISVPHNISLWFRQDWTGDWKEFGDCTVDGVDLAPEFADHQSYRNGVRALRKRIMTGRGGTLSVTLHEPNIVNLQRALYGGTISTPAAASQPTWYDAQRVQIEYKTNAAAGNKGIDFAKFEAAAVWGQLDDDTPVEGGGSNELFAIDVFASTDYAEASQYAQTTSDEIDADGFFEFATAPAVGTWVYVRYAWKATTMPRTEMFGVTVIEGAAQLQARNTTGGAEQLWHFNSVNVASHGAIAYPSDAVQSVPLQLSLMEKDGSFGYCYAK